MIPVNSSWPSADIKTRIEFETKEQAVFFKNQHGGWIAITKDKKIFWYSLSYTPTSIFNDLEGDLYLYGADSPPEIDPFKDNYKQGELP